MPDLATENIFPSRGYVIDDTLSTNIVTAVFDQINSDTISALLCHLHPKP